MSNQDNNKHGYESHKQFLTQIQDRYKGKNREELEEVFNDNFRECVDVLAELTRRTNPSGAMDKEEHLTFNVYSSMQSRIFEEVGMAEIKDQISLFQEYVNLYTSMSDKQREMAKQKEPEEIRNIYGLNQGEGNE